MTDRILVWATILAALSFPALAAGADDGDTDGRFHGWRDMRIIREKSMPDRAIVTDINQDDRDDVVLVDTGQSRLLVYRWVPEAERKKPGPPDPDEPNQIPMAPEFVRETIDFEDLPYDVIVHDLDGKGGPELIVLMGPRMKVVVFHRTKSAGGDEPAWTAKSTWELKECSLGAPARKMLLRKRGKQRYELLIACEKGIQQLALEKDAKADWKSPKEDAPRRAWWLMDLDGDGDEDLITYVGRAGETIRWHEDVNGRLAPSQAISDETVMDIAVLKRAKGAGHVAMLCQVPRGVLRSFAMGKGDASPVGLRRVLPIGGAESWTGIRLGKHKALAYVDPGQPRVLIHVLGANGWEAEQSFPIISDVEQIAAPAGAPGVLLLWSRDAPDLHISRWEKGRLSYPTVWEKSQEVDDRKILSLDSAGGTVWWMQKVGPDLDLYIWEHDAKEPRQVRFEGIGAEADRARWIGGERLLVMEKYARDAKLAVRGEEGVVVTEPAHLKKIALDEFVLIGRGEKRRLARVADGVLQWLDGDLHPTDQVMLPDGARLSQFVPFDENVAWAMEQGGQRLYRLEPDKAGIYRVEETVRLESGGGALMQDAVLGTLIAGSGHVTQVMPGRPRELQLESSLETQTERQTRLDETKIGRFFTTDVTGDGVDDILLVDDSRHYLTLVERKGDALLRRFAWQVFEDSSYPYGGGDYAWGREEVRMEPRDIVALDVDGDEKQDLLLLCHGRLLFYLGGRQEGADE